MSGNSEGNDQRVLTGMRVKQEIDDSAYAVAINYRPVPSMTDMKHDHSRWHKKKEKKKEGASSMVDCFAWPAGFLVRHVLETMGNYSTACTVLGTWRLMSPCYIAVAGGGSEEGTILTREEFGDIKRRQLKSHNKGENMALVQANHDHWEREPSRWHSLSNLQADSWPRVRTAISALRRANWQTSPEVLWHILSQSPLWDIEQTVHGNVICPALNLFESRLFPLEEHSHLPPKSRKLSRFHRSALKLQLPYFFLHSTKKKKRKERKHQHSSNKK